MAVAFYDNNQAYFNDLKLADVDRVYCFDWHLFGPAEWATLDRIYRTTPGWQGYQQEIPFWFGITDNAIPHLCASVEASGLQICGVIPVDDWLAWVLHFETAIADLPLSTCG